MSEAQEREALGEGSVVVEWRGAEFVIPASIEEWDLDALEAFEAGKSAGFAQALLGEDQYAQLKRLGSKVRDFTEFMEVVAKAAGFDSVGE